MTHPLSRRAWLGTGLAAGLGAWGLPTLGRVRERIQFGVVPYLPARRLVALYSPVLPTLESALGQPVEIVSAPSYGAHLQRLRAGDYDVVADSLFLSRIAQRDLSHVPVVRTKAQLEPVLVVPAQGGVTKLSELSGRAVCVTDRLAALSVIGLRYLRDQGLVPGQEFKLVVSGSHANSLNRMLAGEAAAAIVSRTTLKQVAPEMAQRVHVLLTFPPALSAVVYHVAPTLTAKAPALAQALLNFANKTPAGHAFIEALGHEGLVPATAAELSSLDPVVAEFYSQLSVAE
ncbi:MAG: phosphate/phosphite/phosphonate ABC transporter substrate-binding protein [Leptothrix ochracea]|uniref:phosphate/phosphite/phosphonate ABC transporter substrate-binding protein n=1 Tax=Leptothrix ochracea TaxID=735331 RepID=UPI0034E2D9B2